MKKNNFFLEIESNENKYENKFLKSLKTIEFFIIVTWKYLMINFINLLSTRYSSIIFLKLSNDKRFFTTNLSLKNGFSICSKKLSFAIFFGPIKQSQA